MTVITLVATLVLTVPLVPWALQVPDAEDELNVPGFAYGSDFLLRNPLDHIEMTLGLTAGQIETFHGVTSRYSEEYNRVLELGMQPEKLDDELRSLKRGERHRILMARMNQELARDFYRALSPEQRERASRFVVQGNMQEDRFALFLQRPWVQSRLKITDAMLPANQTFPTVPAKLVKLKEVDRELRQEVLSVLPVTERRKFTPLLPEADAAEKPTGNMRKWFREFASWQEIITTIQAKSVNLKEALDLSDQQGMQLMQVQREFSAKFNKELSRLSKEKLAEVPPEKLSELSAEVSEEAGKEVGREAVERINEILLPFQEERLALLLIQQCFEGQRFYYTVHQMRVLKFLDIDRKYSKPLMVAAEDALKKRPDLIQKLNAEFQLKIVEQLPEEQQQLFEKHFGKYLK